MTHPTHVPVAPGPALRLSDADRDAVADRIRAAAGEGRLTMAEADERQTLAYAARTADDLHPLVADLPAPPAPEPDRSLTPRARRRLAVHAAVVAVLVVAMVTRWALGDSPWFWPAFPMFWLAVSLAVHVARAPRMTGR